MDYECKFIINNKIGNILLNVEYGMFLYMVIWFLCNIIEYI